MTARRLWFGLGIAGLVAGTWAAAPAGSASSRAPAPAGSASSRAPAPAGSASNRAAPPHSPDVPPVVDPKPASVIHGADAFRLTTIVAVARLDGDAADDLVLHEQPDGLVSREVVYVVSGRDSWPATIRTNALGAVALMPPGARQDESLLVVGVGDLSGDGMADIAALRTQMGGGSLPPDRIYLYAGRASWPRGGTIASPDATLVLPERGRVNRIAMADVNHDDRPDALLYDDSGLKVMFGDGAWSGEMPWRPDLVLSPRVLETFVADLDRDAVDDLLFNLSTDFNDVAWLRGRQDWPAEVNLLQDSDWLVGEGRDRFEVRNVMDTDGDADPEVAMFDAVAQQLLVFDGNEGPTTWAVPDDARWAIGGVEYTLDDVQAADLNADGAADWIINRRDVFYGLPQRWGVYQAATGDVDATWETYPAGTAFRGDVNGDGRPDLLVNQPGASRPGQASTGVITLFLGPVLAPESLPTPRASSTARPTSTPTPPTPTTQPTAWTPTSTATTPRPSGATIHLPIARHGPPAP